MKQAISVRNRVLCLCLVAAVTYAAPMACKKQAAGDGAVAIFVIGTVTVERPGALSRAVVHKDELRSEDTVTTGPQSLLVAQFGAETLVEVGADSTVRFSSLLKDGATTIELERGNVISRVQRLGKTASYQVHTRTSLAAVRGTEFRVTSGDDGSVVAVSSGSVAVGRSAPEGAPAGETMIEKGRAAEVTKTITVRPINDGEKEEFARFGTIKPVQDLESASESDLKKLEDEYRKNNEEDGQDGKTAAGKAVGKDATEDPVAAKVRLWTGKQVYASSEPVVVFYKDMPDYRNCWIDLSRASDSDGRYRSYNWTYSATSGRMTFSDLGLEPGVYELRVHFSKSSAVSKRFRFQVR